ncbi:hypothetical protein [Acaryochloris sp. CCMEE 5410]|uniref:hypothetical protein n=1 Tax=Acaryochloris sp. CCMEE 5410 TaxID=310037 RepID=UPI00024846CC|nr:hypothetical protein [Acaryochloris sp. CCMEE 5410]KAI9135143.1 hypothetical protein ON05_019155 [Acaryochloris sp. CCMEE 5410]
MNSSIQMQAVVESPYDAGEFLCPWPVPEFKPLSMIRLWGEMTYPEIGLVFAQLARYNQIELANNKHTVLEQILEAESLVLPGGIQIVSEAKVIPPSCCCGLETWREWIDFLQTGYSPWLGHDPSPWVERQGTIIRIWSDGGLEPMRDAFNIDVSQPEFEKALMGVERELQAFLFSIESWAQDIGVAEPNQLFQKFDHCFNIRKAA